MRAIWHDGQFTYIKADATELPALYEIKDGKPALVNFQVRERHVRGAEGARPGLPGARQGAVLLRAAGAVSHGRDVRRAHRSRDRSTDHRPVPAASCRVGCRRG